MESAKAEVIVDQNRKYNFFSWAVQSKVETMAVAGGEGVWFWDEDGNRYLDFISQLMNVNAGHQHPKIVRGILDQAQKLCYAAPKWATQVRGELAQLLTEVTPDNLSKIFFALGGAEANENAIKFVRGYTGRPKIITRYRSYHGATHGALSLTGDPRHNTILNMPGVVRVFDPYCYRCSFGKERQGCDLECVKHIEEVILYEDPKQIAAIFMEGVAGSNGVLVPPDEYWPRVRELCDKYNIQLVSDEVMTGFGRTGEWFAVDNWGVKPDVMTMAKGLTSAALPLGAVAVSSAIADYFWDRMFWGGLTFHGHALSCAAGLAAVKVYRDEDLIGNAKLMGRLLEAELVRLQERHASIGEYRAIGLFAVLELVKDLRTKEPIVDWQAGETELMDEMYHALMNLGLYTFLTRNWLFIAPPLVIKDEELKLGMGIIDEVLGLADAKAK